MTGSLAQSTQSSQATQITQVARIKQHRAERQARQVKLLGKELAAIRARKAQLTQNLMDFTQWQESEVNRLFAKLAATPATLNQVDDFNGRVSALNTQKHQLQLELKQAETEESNAQRALQEAMEKLQAAERTQEKFQFLREEIHQLQMREYFQHEERLAEEVAADSYQCGHKNQRTINPVTEA